MSSPSKRVSGHTSRAPLQKWPCPVPTSSQAAACAEGFQHGGAGQIRAVHAAEDRGRAADAETVVEVAVVEVESVQGQARVLEDMPAAAALFEGEAARLGLELIRHPGAYGEVGGAAPGAVGAARLEEPLGARLEFGLIAGPERFHFRPGSGRGRSQGGRRTEGGVEGAQRPRRGGARQVGRAQRAVRSAEDQRGLQPVQGECRGAPAAVLDGRARQQGQTGEMGGGQHTRRQSLGSQLSSTKGEFG